MNNSRLLAGILKATGIVAFIGGLLMTLFWFVAGISLGVGAALIALVFGVLASAAGSAIYFAAAKILDDTHETREMLSGIDAQLWNIRNRIEALNADNAEAATPANYSAYAHEQAVPPPSVGEFDAIMSGGLLRCMRCHNLQAPNNAKCAGCGVAFGSIGRY